nr:PREDICTED: uncharacterized protein LOC108215956 isoform X2 [Daucus carota subsp. sativus]
MFTTLTKLLENNSRASATAVKCDADNIKETNGCDAFKTILNCRDGSKENQLPDTMIKDETAGSDPEKSSLRARTSLLSYLTTPVSRSGSVSLRSNSSSASTQSFAFPDLGSLNYLKPVSRSGSVCLRSNSSSASTQSFAFPVIVSDSYNSPARMVKAEKRTCSRIRRQCIAFFRCCKLSGDAI